MNPSSIEHKQLAAAHRILKHLAEVLDIPFSVRLWDGSVVPLGRHADKNLFFVIEGPRTLTTILRKPTLENVFRHYAVGKIDLQGAGLLTIINSIPREEVKKRVKRLNKMLIFRAALPFLFGPTENLTLNFSKFHLEYFMQKPDGSGEPAGECKWDIAANESA